MDEHSKHECNHSVWWWTGRPGFDSWQRNVLSATVFRSVLISSGYWRRFLQDWRVQNVVLTISIQAGQRSRICFHVSELLLACICLHMQTLYISFQHLTCSSCLSACSASPTRNSSLSGLLLLFPLKLTHRVGLSYLYKVPFRLCLPALPTKRIFYVSRCEEPSYHSDVVLTFISLK
jgi:hypothetical protein